MTKTEHRRSALDKPARVMSGLAIAVSVLSLAAAIFSAYQSYVSAQSALTQVRPIVRVRLPTPIEVDAKLVIPITLSNVGNSRATIQDVRLVVWRDEAHGDRSYSVSEAYLSILFPGESLTLVLEVPRFVSIRGATVDVSQGLDSSRRLGFDLLYEGQDLGLTRFRDSVRILAKWIDEPASSK